MIVHGEPGWAAETKGLAPGTHLILLGGDPVDGRKAGLELRDTILVMGPLGVELAVLFRVPCTEPTVAAQVMKTGTGVIHIDACRTPSDMTEFFSSTGKPRSGLGHAHGFGMGEGYGGGKANPPHKSGRWPSNVILVHDVGCERVGTRQVPTGTAVERNRDGEVHNKVFGARRSLPSQDQSYGERGLETVAAWDCTPTCLASVLDDLSGELPAAGNLGPSTRKTTSDVAYGTWGVKTNNPAYYKDSGGASRFYPQIESPEAARVWFSMLIGIENPHVYLSSGWGGMSHTAFRVLRRYLTAAEGETPKKKRMVLMIGPPAAGKGFFLGETEKGDTGETKKYKTEGGEEKETRAGYKLPKMTSGLFKDSDIPDRPEADESDNHLRAIQFEESKQHYDTLKAAHAKGKAEFDKALDDMWYETKDGEKVSLGKQGKVSFDAFPESHQAFHKQVNKDFYVSMRGWHDDAKQKNPETGKPKERYKDEARHRFDDAIQGRTEKDNDLLIVDSAGEDIDAQDFKGQIQSAKQNGYEVSVIFLHPEQADTELSNLSRGKVMGKRMVDGADIDNWYKQNEAALKEIQSAAPDNFLHYRKGPPDPDPKKAAELRAKARDLMNGLSKMSEEEAKKAKKEIGETLYAKASYNLQKETSWAKTLPAADLPKKPEKSIAEAVKAQNKDAEERSDKYPEARVKPPSKEEKSEEEKPKSDGAGKGGEKSKTRTDFLREVGDKEVHNPNPEGHKKQIKVRSLPWEHQKKYYEQWAQKQASLALRVAVRYAKVIGRAQ